MIKDSRITPGSYHSEAVLFMRSLPPNPDGTIGHMVKPIETREWADWQDYFDLMGMQKRASLMRVSAINGFMVPARHPSDFDPAYRRTRASKPRERMPSEMTLEERTQIAERLRRLPFLRATKAAA